MSQKTENNTGRALYTGEPEMEDSLIEAPGRGRRDIRSPCAEGSFEQGYKCDCKGHEGMMLPHKTLFHSFIKGNPFEDTF